MELDALARIPRPEDQERGYEQERLKTPGPNEMPSTPLMHHRPSRLQ